MKRMIALMLVLLTVMTAAAGCRSNQTQEPNNTTDQTTNTTNTMPATTAPTQPSGGSPESALGLLETVWALYGEEEKFFAAGGDENNAVSDAPGIYDITNADALMFSLLVPEGQIAGIREAANLVHAMNSNVLSAAAFRLAEGTEAETFAAAMRDAIQNNQWLCGFPEKLLVAVVDGQYVVTAFGQEPLATFEAKLKQAYPTVKILYNEAVN